MQIAVGGCLAQKDRGDDHPQGAVGRRRLRHPQHRLAAGAARAGPGRSEEAQVEILESLEVFPSTLPTRRESAYAAWVSISRRLQQHLHVLHRARRCAARRRTAGPATSSPRSRRWSPRASSRSPCSARTSTPTASSSATGRRSASCCAPAARSTGLERVRFTSPHPADFTDDVIAAMAETPNVMPQLHMPLQSGSDTVLKAMRRSYRQRAATSASSTGSAPRCPTPRSPPTSSSASPARPRRTSQADPGRRPRRRGSPAPSPSSTPSAPAPRPPTMADQVPEGGRAGALRAAGRARQDEIAWEENKTLVGRTVEVLVAEGEGRKDAATHRLSGRAPDNRLVHFAVPGRRRRRRGPATWSPSRSPTPPRTTWSPTAPFGGVRRTRAGDAWEARRAARRSPPACCSACRRWAPRRSPRPSPPPAADVLVAAAVCPHPPLLVPGVGAGASGELDGLRVACDAAVLRPARRRAGPGRGGRRCAAWSAPRRRRLGEPGRLRRPGAGGVRRRRAHPAAVVDARPVAARPGGRPGAGRCCSGSSRTPAPTGAWPWARRSPAGPTGWRCW